MATNKAKVNSSLKVSQSKAVVSEKKTLNYHDYIERNKKLLKLGFISQIQCEEIRKLRKSIADKEEIMDNLERDYEENLQKLQDKVEEGKKECEEAMSLVTSVKEKSLELLDEIQNLSNRKKMMEFKILKRERELRKLEKYRNLLLCLASREGNEDLECFKNPDKIKNILIRYESECLSRITHNSELEEMLKDKCENFKKTEEIYKEKLDALNDTKNCLEESLKKENQKSKKYEELIAMSQNSVENMEDKRLQEKIIEVHRTCGTFFEETDWIKMLTDIETKRKAKSRRKKNTRSKTKTKKRKIY
ncbi:ELKS/Rab6-interacting/CAST family member 1-like isoform X2 [Centruroides sculpturatus]|uniref:ELKS/Rab6-interacting/CAST family member 1-like isoform X2 n=1 Tax=Centruroides sculpturatus TaxID=218467 RepID=UPI000C6CE43C|nr:ELKS/Rab6-interacting/CAST family member 1-like isoform X2 [Centruroides sculpturatus]